MNETGEYTTVLNKKQKQKQKQKVNKIAIQGIQGSFHEIAALKYFGDEIETLACDSFEMLFEELEEGHADFGIMAIENSVAGTILSNYALLRESNFKVIGEVFLRIEHHLMTLSGQNLNGLKSVYSHRMALLQCRNFFKENKTIKPVKANDTAESAFDLSRDKEEGRGVIASKRAADLYKMEIIAKNIEDNKRNFTRFLVLEKNSSYIRENNWSNKASLSFCLAHESGSLAAVLTVLASFQMNLTKIQSLPLIGKEWVYYFHLDMVYEDYSRFRRALEAIAPMIGELKILGEYKKGDRIVMEKA